MARKTIITGLLAGALLAIPGAAAGLQRFHLSQARVQLPDVTAYADLLDDAGNAIGEAPSVHASASLGGHGMKFVSLTPFARTGEGVAYVFVVDTSESIGPARFDGVRTAIESWVQGIDAKDRVAIVEFAEKVHVLADFSDSKEKTLAAAHTLARHGKKSLIYQALVQAVELSSRRDAGLPVRRAIVVVTDGKDEGSGLKSDDVLEQALGSHVPIYAVGYSNLPPAEQRQYLDELHRIAGKSGGDYAEVEGAGLTETFAGMKNAIRRVFVAGFSCAECAADSRKVRFDMQVEAGSRTFSDGFDVLATPGPPPPAVQQAPVSTKTKTPWWQRPWWVYAAAGLLVVIALAGGVWMARRRRAKATARRSAPMVPLAMTMPSPAGGSVPVFPTAEPPGPSLVLRFTVVRGRKRGSTVQLRIPVLSTSGSVPDGNGGRLVIGRRTACDLALSDDETVSSEHCEIRWSNDRLVVRDLHSSNGTLVNGVPIAGDYPLEGGDCIAIGQTEYRVGMVDSGL
jgi:Mg-chelatase subunit ChlD